MNVSKYNQIQKDFYNENADLFEHLNRNIIDLVLTTYKVGFVRGELSASVECKEKISEINKLNGLKQ